ncbi:MAG: hypothetical protein HY717_06995 [Planctomycetes bacterium]|nr:hypothetical protein [Planctomycetota bacterium]
MDLSRSVLVARGDKAPEVERTAARVLAEEIERRTGIRLPAAARPVGGRPFIALTSNPSEPVVGLQVPERARLAAGRLGAEGFHVSLDTGSASSPGLWVLGADPRGVLFGAGYLLRKLDLEPGSIVLSGPIEIATARRYPLRGHQLGYRNRANSYDAWDDRRYEQYIRELAFFGANAIENIPFEGEAGPHLPLPRREMNRKLSEICKRYGLEYWIWTPADFDLGDEPRRRRALEEHDQLFRDCPRLDGIFFPGGDPGRNHPRLVMPYLEELAALLAKRHPQARLWISLQGFDEERVGAFYQYLEMHRPEWLGGVVCGPSSPPIPETRRRLAPRYRLRHYPDITHTVRCQYPVPWWDPAFAHTLGREPINPRPLHSAAAHNLFAPYTGGFITYSDGVHDDVNKTIWSALGWNPEAEAREILIDYARVFLDRKLAPEIADALLALERNWEGPLARNGGVEAALKLVEAIGEAKPALAENWRWQMVRFRASYDATIRHRLIREATLEEEANAILLRAGELGAERAMGEAGAVLAQPDGDARAQGLRERIENLAGALWKSIGLQTSVPRYQASGAERGAVLDFLDHPLNNRWWLEDQFKRIAELPSSEEKARALAMIAGWEHPGPGSFYDEVGNIAKSPHILRGEGNLSEIIEERVPLPDVMWWDEGLSRRRLSWISFMNWPVGLRYEGLDPAARYLIRLTGYGDAFLRIDGERVQPALYGKGIGEFKEFEVPARLLEDGRILLTFDRPPEPGVNWREQSRLNEVWLLKK